MNESEALSRQLYQRRHLGVLVPFGERSIDGWRPAHHQCHNNADYWAIKNPGDKAVRGWLVFDYYTSSKGLIPVVQFTAHSIVEAADGTLFDLTPSHASQLYPFLRHEGSNEEFVELVETDQITNVYYQVERT